MKILLTNDDSHRSPLLAIILDKLVSLGEVVVVVPKHEQSWRGKSMSRFTALQREKISLFGHPAWTVDGTPADCVNLGIYHLCHGKPDLVVSGINAGLNTGVGFVLSSGTVGACFEANIAGVPAVALSQQFDSAAMNEYAAEYALSQGVVDHLRAQAQRVLDPLFEALLAAPTLCNSAITWNINLPYRLRKEPSFRVSRLGQLRYGSFFAEGDGVYQHRLADIFYDRGADSDSAAINDGDVSVTPLDIFSFGQWQLSSAIESGTEFAARAQIRPRRE